MAEESFRKQLRKKILDLKPETEGFYTELYNLVYVMFRLSPDSLPKDSYDTVEKKLNDIYLHPNKKRKVSLSQAEQIYFRYKNDQNLRIKSRQRTDFQDIKKSLDKVRRDMLFYLAIVEDRPKDYGIILESAKNDADT